MSEQPPQQAAEPERSAVDPARGGGRHELPPDEPAPEIGELHAGGVKGVARRGRSQLVFGALAVVLCVLLGVAIATQARQTESGDSLETARPADLLVLLDSLQQREAALNTEVADLQRTLGAVAGVGQQRPGRDRERAGPAGRAVDPDRHGRRDGSRRDADDRGHRARRACRDHARRHQRAAGRRRRGDGDPWRRARPSGSASTPGWSARPARSSSDSATLNPPYSVLAIGDPPTLAAAMNIPGGAMDSVERVGGTMAVQQSDRVDVTALRQPKPRQYAQPVK